MVLSLALSIVITSPFAAGNLNSFNVFPGPSHEKSNSFQLSPKTFFSELANASGHKSASNSEDQEESEEEVSTSIPKRKKVKNNFFFLLLQSSVKGVAIPNLFKLCKRLDDCRITLNENVFL